ncbi:MULTISPECIES: cytochrome C oxidase subunit IV family protein [Sphingobium]|uniref:cytochrome C oxidase subunit IV family protein n=1 Tax=Sphingobium sp. MI1205 TaxID=407020 RepID=UPI00077066FD|nr:cytochrome C oxidase subunit IV family protein [Sphingobium sp. MI1205]AMK19971.1 hypothetical protein K663_18051 [Sphingobium sp. MI1205]
MLANRLSEDPAHRILLREAGMQMGLPRHYEDLKREDQESVSAMTAPTSRTDGGRARPLTIVTNAHTEPHPLRRSARRTAYLFQLDAARGHARLVGTAILVVAFFKAWLIGMRYMELDHAVLPLRFVYGVWVLVVGIRLGVLLWMA